MGLGWFVAGILVLADWMDSKALHSSFFLFLPQVLQVSSPLIATGTTGFSSWRGVKRVFSN